MKESQEPKYNANALSQIFNRSTGVPIPSSEPIFIFRAKDRNALAALYHYQKRCDNWKHKDVIGQRIHDFKMFAIDHPELMKEPDSA